MQIQVTFEIDPNGIVSVSATDLETGQRASTTISLSSGLTDEDIHAAADRTANMEVAEPRGPGTGRGGTPRL